MECIECGSCSYICPAKRPLAQYIKTMKKTDLSREKKRNNRKRCRTVSELYNISSSPHIRAKDTSAKNHALCHYRITAGKYLWCVQLRAAGFVIDCSLYRNLCGIRMDFLKRLYIKKSTITDFSAVLTGLLLALNLPYTLPIWQAVLGSVFAIVIVKMLFGGLGQNFMNPALGARCFLACIFCKHHDKFYL